MNGHEMETSTNNLFIYRHWEYIYEYIYLLYGHEQNG